MRKLKYFGYALMGLGFLTAMVFMLLPTLKILAADISYSYSAQGIIILVAGGIISAFVTMMDDDPPKK